MPPKNPVVAPVENPAPAGDLAASATSLLNSMPEPQENAIAEFEREAAEKLAAENAEATPATSTAPAANPSSGKVDKNGVAFDSAKHTGTLLKNGLWRERKNAAAGSQVNIPANKKNAKAAEVPAADRTAAARVQGQAAAAIMFRVGETFGGDEWRPDDEKEFDYFSKAFGDYMLAKNIGEISPGWALAMALISYPASRSQRPETSKKFGRIRMWITLRFTAWRLKSAFKKNNIKAAVEIKDGKIIVDGKPQ